MEKIDYSEDALLTEMEVTDYDTKDFHETGINEDRAHLPTRYDVEKSLRERSRKRHGKSFKFSKDFDWQITYSFPSSLRNPMYNGVQYGGKAVTFRRLYLILCEHFNGGKYFIDDYFETCYPSSYVKQQVDATLETIKSELLDVANTIDLSEAEFTKRGTLDKRKKVNEKYFQQIDEYEAFARDWEESYGEEISALIKEDIINSLATGIIPLQNPHYLSERTIKLRQRAGIDSEERFYATSQLINSLILYINIGGNGKWQTQSGLMV